MEDIAGVMARKAKQDEKDVAARAEKPKPMVSARHREQLTKEGYKIVRFHANLAQLTVLWG